MTRIRDAFVRAAQRGGPLYSPFLTYQAVLDDRGRPVAGEYLWVENAYGYINWREVDEFNKTTLGQGHGTLTLVAPFAGCAPDLVLGQDGTFHLTGGTLGQDGLGVSYRLRVSRWSDKTPPIIREDAP